jgi:hypothetical protein
VHRRELRERLAQLIAYLTPHKAAA